MEEPKRRPDSAELLPFICGVDEAGRGPLAGPVVAAAVVLSSKVDDLMLDDSKRMQAAAREQAAAAIRARGCAIGLGWVWPREIDAINIHRASLLAMARAVRDLRRRHRDQIIQQIRVDGRFCPPPDQDGPPCVAIIGGDHLEPPIMAASIIAKVTRDRWIRDYDTQDPRYGLAGHKGYPTPAHREALRRHGPCPQHRLSFRGVAPPPRGDQPSSEL